jgi:16S rRNA C967 or C1407 C5-methylase (RsmB/RsmF family)
MKGRLGFEEYYSNEYKERWPLLKNALLADKHYILVGNSFTNYNFNLENKINWYPNSFETTTKVEIPSDESNLKVFYPIDGASLFPVMALDLHENDKVLDLCAAPGGKSTLLNSLLNNESALIANEVVKQRADVLAQNISKWGTSNVVVTNNDPSSYSEMENVFDIILVDAPCSGSGLFRKQHDAVDEWSLDNVNLCCQRQKRILSDVIGSLKQGGTLVYSTCSYSQQENEDIADWLMTEFELTSVEIPTQKTWGIV